MYKSVSENKTNTKSNKKFPLKFNVFDVIVGVIAILLSVVLIVINNSMFSNNVEMENKVAYVYYDSSLVRTVYLKDVEDVETVVLKKKDYPLLNDDMTILISKEKGIKVEEEKSPQKICSKQGWVSRVDVPVVCLPNSVYVIISDINQVDIDIGLQ